MIATSVNVPFEMSFRVGDTASAATREVDVTFAGPGGEARVPAFWAGENVFRVRYAPSAAGAYTWALDAGDGEVLSGPLGGEFDVVDYSGDNPLYRHGRLRASASRRTLEHADGTPFFWLGDTWWAALSPRLHWPDGFRELTADRVAKGFNVVQLVAGAMPLFFGPDAAWHPQQANEGGWPWEPGWERLNPAFYDAADRRIEHLVERGIVPCILAMWGLYLPQMGVERVKRHWRNLIARYAAYPVVLCLCGEADIAVDVADFDEQKAGWTEVGRYVRELDPFHNVLTVHPGHPESRTVIDDESVLDLNILQTAHWGFHTPSPELLEVTRTRLRLDEPPRFGLAGSIEALVRALDRQPTMPTLNAEPSYEGHWGSNWQEVQRFQFWASVLSGAAGHTYGAVGLWNMSSATEPWAPLGSYAGDGVWQQQGSGTWQEAMHWPGGRQVAMGRGFFERYRWWEFEPLLRDEVERAGRRWSFAAGIPGEVLVCYLGALAFDVELQGLVAVDLWEHRPTTIPLDGSGRAYYFDPRNGADIDLGDVRPDAAGRWAVPRKPTDEDWVLVVEMGSGGKPIAAKTEGDES